jgi:hypothetical protein
MLAGGKHNGCRGAACWPADCPGVWRLAVQADRALNCVILRSWWPKLTDGAYALARMSTTLPTASRPSTIASTRAPHAASAAAFSSAHVCR